MGEYLQQNKASCKNCYKCIRYCPVKSIRFSDDKADIISDECILCGMCYVVCPQEAKYIRDDTDAVKEMIASSRPVYASIAPSFAANYDGVNITAMENALKKLGFAGASETAIGATIVKKHYDDMVNNNSQNIIITTCCHTVNTLIQKYYPPALPFLAHLLSPMQAHCREIKKEHPDALTVFIGPCISKKEEAAQYEGIVDKVLTFQELTKWLREEGIAFEKTEERTEKGRARFFPVPGGILHSMFCENEEYTYLCVDGIENCTQTIKDVIEGKLTKCFLELSACRGSCTGGPATDNQQRRPVRDYLAVKAYAGPKDFILPHEDKEELAKSIPFIGLHRQIPGSKAIEEILKRMGKTAPEHELNCGACGYNTCRDKALAVHLGKADITMCLPYLVEKAESFSDNVINNTPNGIVVLNEDLEIQQINASARRIFDIRSEKELIGAPVSRILDSLNYVPIMSTEENIHNKTVYLDKYDKYVDETVFFDKTYRIIVILMRDITEEELQKAKKESIARHTIEVTDKVVEKHMRVVQEIASLLGETAAETKIALTKLKETLRNE